MIKIKTKKWYTPREIVNLGLIESPRKSGADSTYLYILRLIERGNLQAKNYGKTGTNVRPRWLVSEEAIEAYHAN